MVNAIWVFMLCVGVAVAAFSGHIDTVASSALKAAELGISVGINLMGIMSLWLGLMHIAERAGLIRALAKICGPTIRKLFPDLKPDSPALGSIIMNLCANVFGLGSAATPFGLKAMKELQEENPHPDRASRSMITFLTLNTSCITLVPATIIGIRIAAGSVKPTEIVGTTIFATGCAMLCSVIVDWFFRQRNEP